MLLVGVSSLVTGLLVAFVVSLIEIGTDVALYGFSAALVIPIGAIGCGLFAAAGFFAASRLFHVRPEGPVLAVPLVTAAATFFATHWFTFLRYELPTGLTHQEVLALDGRGFVDYLRLVATESGVTLGSSSAPTTIDRLGSWGYGVVAIEILGFALGGWFVASILRRKPWCQASGRFLKPLGKHVRYFDDPDRFESSANHLVDVLERGGPDAAFEYAAAEKASMKQRRNARFVINTTHYECGQCGLHHTVVATQHRVNNNWANLSQTPLHPEVSPTDAAAHELVS